MDWPPDPATWPHARHSRQIPLSPHRWHVQVLGDGPDLVLLHGAGGALHSWRGLIPLLADRYRVIAVDLPGHGYTRSPGGARSGLDAMTQDLSLLIAAQGWRPAALIGHSAGGALALRLAGRLDPMPAVVGINAALTPFDGVAGWLFPLLARMLAANPLTPLLFTLGRSGTGQARKLVEGTGSCLDEQGYALYARLMADRRHVNGALQMMARWSLDDLLRDLPRITAQTLLITGDRDRAVAPSVAVAAADRMPDARVLPLTGLGHLAHEEDPAAVAAAMAPFLAAHCPAT
ncbi:alpha/beta fold hydrolase BchO [Maliponia aquimaris]|uniref:Tropinesterase n=1 Tax=Maliponia aquimaris TaxID=1673631 RepID=A0A238JRV4_9RHOB|nr:alpha/beta fold hydrolase BchO [Maliponia aquimaris]SMX32924.1 Tropinesterase [Maliponia aquimaris]